MNTIILATLINIGQLTQTDSTREEVMDVINRLFEGMKLADSAMVRDVFTQNARLITVYEQDGKPGIREGSVEGFVRAVGTPREEVWNEPIWDYEVRIDGRLAQVWTKYAFYLDDKFSHCGVDAFQLFRGEDGWKIFQLTDTRKKENCEIPPNR